MSFVSPLLLDISSGQLHSSALSSKDLHLSIHSNPDVHPSSELHSSPISIASDLNSSTTSLPSTSFFVMVSPTISMSSISSTPVSFTMSTPPSSPVDVEQKP